MKPLIAFAFLLIPSVVFAGQTIGDLINTATSLVLFAVPIAVAAALLFFLWNMFQLITSLDDAEKKKQARPRMIWGIIALFVILSVGALVTVLEQTFFGSGSNLQQSPSTIGGGDFFDERPGEGRPGGEDVFTPDTGSSPGGGSGGSSGSNPFRPDESGCSFLMRITGNCDNVIEA